MKSDQEQVKKAASKVAEGASKEHTETYKQAIQKLAKDAATPKNILGLSDRMVEGMYGQAYRLYNTGKYTEAMELFRMLILINNTEVKYILGLAACFHMLKEYKGAVETYMMCTVFDPDSPLPYYHSSDCYIQMNDAISAIISLEMAIKKAGDQPEFQVLKDRAQMTIDALKKEMGKQTKKKKKKK